MRWPLLAGNQAATTRLLPGNEGDSAKPSMKRKANSTTMATPPAKKPTNPWAMVNIDQRQAEGVNGLRAETVEQPAARQLPIT